MRAPHAILLVPAEGDPGGLLARGPCGARPPTVHRESPTATWCDCEDGGLYYPSALPFWWNNRPVAEGWDRARRVASAYTSVPWAHSVSDPDTEAAVKLGRALELCGDGLCRVVVLDLVDGVLVERAP